MNSVELEHLKDKLIKAEKCIKILREEVFILGIEHIQDIVALKYAYGVSVEDTLNEIDRLDLLDFLTNEETGLNTKDYALGHALVQQVANCTVLRTEN